jgi:hypothetical protein
MLRNVFRLKSHNLSVSFFMRYLTTQSDGISVTAISQKTSKENDNSTFDSDVSRASNDGSKETTNVSKTTTESSRTTKDVSKTTAESSKTLNVKNKTRPLPKTTTELQRKMREDFFRREAEWEKLVDFERLTEDEMSIHQCHKEAIQGNDSAFSKTNLKLDS